MTGDAPVGRGTDDAAVGHGAEDAPTCPEKEDALTGPEKEDARTDREADDAANPRVNDDAASDGEPRSAPEGYVGYDRAREELPGTTGVEVSEAVTLETLHCPGPPPTLVFVHGGLGSPWNPYPQLATFEGECGLVSYSLAGNRDSSDRPVHTLDGHVSDLAGLLDELDVDEPVIHGHSYGTTVALEYAKRHDVAGLVVAGGGDHHLTASFERPFLGAMLALRLYRLPFPDWLSRRAMGNALHPDAPPTVVADAARANPLPRRREAYVAPRAFRGYDGRGETRGIDVPALVIHGRADGVVPPEVARSTADRLPDAVYAGLDGAGHMPFLERPAAYDALLRALLECVREGTDLGCAVDRRFPEAGSEGDRRRGPDVARRPGDRLRRSAGAGAPAGTVDGP